MKDSQPSDRPPNLLIRHLEDRLSLPHRPEGSAARPSRAGQLYQVQLGERFFALKLYDGDGYYNDAFFFDLMNHVRIGAGEAKRGFFEGYGDPGLEARQDLLVFRAYHLFGKLIHLSATGARERYEQRRTQLQELAARIGLR